MKYKKEVASISLIAVAAFSGLAYADAASLTFEEEVSLDAKWSEMRVPKWSNGAAIDVQYDQAVNSVIWLLDRHSPRTVLFTIPGATSMSIFDWDRGIDGTIGLSGQAIDGEGRASNFVAWISGDETKSNIIQTSLYTPRQLAVAPDGTLWTAGSEFITLKSHVLKAGFGVVRHFDRTGQTLGSFISQSTIHGGGASLWSTTNRFRASKDRIVWYSPEEARYVEISLTGQVLTDILIQRPGDSKGVVDGLAVTDKHQVFVSAVSYSAPNVGGKERTILNGIYILDKTAQAWQPVLQRTSTTGVKQNPSDFADILGIDGDRLVIRSVQHRLRFYKIGE